MIFQSKIFFFMIFVCLKKTNRRFHPPNICIRGLKMGVSGDILGWNLFCFFSVISWCDCDSNAFWSRRGWGKWWILGPILPVLLELFLKITRFGSFFDIRLEVGGKACGRGFESHFFWKMFLCFCLEIFHLSFYKKTNLNEEGELCF